MTPTRGRVRREHVVERRVHEPGRHAVHADVGCELERRRGGERHDRRLGRRVRRLTAGGAHARDARDVDDRTAAGSADQRSRRTDAVEGGADVDPPDQVDLSVGVGLDRLEVADPRVVHEPSQPAELGRRALQLLVERGTVGDVGDQGESADLVRDRLRAVGDAVEHPDAQSVGSESPTQIRAQARRPAGHHDTAHDATSPSAAPLPTAPSAAPLPTAPSAAPLPTSPAMTTVGSSVMTYSTRDMSRKRCSSGAMSSA